VTAQFDAARSILSATNRYSLDYAGRIAFMAASEPLSFHCASRAAFLGTNGTPLRPLAVDTAYPLVSTTDVGGDPVLAVGCDIELAPGAEREIIFHFGDAPERSFDGVIERLKSLDFDRLITATDGHWDGFLGTLQVETPDHALDRMVNTWLPYQNLACRVRARAAFYQASGAFGFRDQLQDTAALILHDPTLARAQIINAASRQFEEGDVQHWWLPATGAGVRTNISDDVVWLAFCTHHYIKATGDKSVLDETIPFLVGPPLEPGRHDSFYRPELSAGSASLYEHCARALDLAIARTGPHGIPLIMGGDWNDGMNRVGEKGTGESVWLGWFLAVTLHRFEKLAVARGDQDRAKRWKSHRKAVTAALETHCWDGDHYLRGFYDDGTPLGANSQPECRIDSIAQSWSVLSGAADPQRASAAMDAVLSRLASDEDGVVRLFTPAFDKTEKDPGYIKGYPPGVRENGGQYTHAATWVVYALAQMGRGADAHRCFSLLNPVNHALDAVSAEKFRVEPYSVPADVYGEDEKTGRGGWTWYTGSAGWLWRSAVEAILGIRLDGGKLIVTPSLPPHWPGFTATIRKDGKTCRIEVEQTKPGKYRVEVNGKALADASEPFDIG
jgi:cyclic beta-1,2-glucan synthetase